MVVRPPRALACRRSSARRHYASVALLRFVLLLACVLAITSCDNGSNLLVVQGPQIDLPPVWGDCPDPDDELSNLLPKDLASPLPSVSAGTIAGSFSVTSTGEAVYELRFDVVPGRAAMQPELSLSYEGSSGEGLLGMGFSIGGLSSIARCPKGIPDGDIEPVREKPGDALCMDGRKLLPVDPASEKPFEYRTFPETFTKIVADYAEGEGWDADRGPKSFQAFTKAGLILEFGAADTGLVLARSGVVRSWLLTRMRDRSGNAIDYTYINTKHPTGGHTVEHAPSRIDYTAHPDAPATRAVLFDYSSLDAADVRVLFARGMELRRSLRLDHIRMQGPGNALVRQYNLAYATAPVTRRLLLQQVEECAADGICKPPTRFEWSHGKAPGFVDLPTSIKAPESKLGTVMLLDTTGDGLDDLVVPDVDMLAGEELPITDWIVAPNKSALITPSFFDTSGIAYQQNHYETPVPVQPDVGSPLDYDHDGRMDIFLHDLHGKYSTWRVLLAKPDLTLAMKDTGVKRPYPQGAPPPLHLNSEMASAHLADVSGDGQIDLLQCKHDGTDFIWRVHLWKPDGPGFDQAGSPITALEGRVCDAQVQTVDIDSDGRVDLLVQKAVGPGLGDEFEALSYVHSNTSWSIAETNLTISPQGGRLIFLDVNGDSLPDAVKTGFGEPLTFMNTGDGFSGEGHKSLPAFVPDVESFARLATPIDWNEDGKTDLLWPMPSAGRSGIPVWMILQATGNVGDGTFEPIDSGIPFEAEALLDAKVTLADPHGPRVTDVDGDGIQDVLLSVGNVFHVFKNVLHEEDLLVSVTDGMNGHDPGDPDFMPNVQISYEHLIDLDRATSAQLGIPRESWTYLPHSDAASDSCTYPVRCVVGPRRVVSSYRLATGEKLPRHFEVAYRDGRYHRLGRGFLGFGERIVRDKDTGAGTLEIYDNTSYNKELQAFPYAGQVAHVWQWNPTLQGQRLAGDETVELLYTDIGRETVKTLGGRSYFTLPIVTRQRREQGSVATCDPVLIEGYVRETAESPALMMSDSMRVIWDHDAYGNVEEETAATQGVDESLHIERTFENDESEWLLGLVKTETECSTAGALTQCRTSERTYNDAGLLRSEKVGTPNGDPEMERTLKLSRDAFGNVIKTTDKDGSGHYRYTCTSYESEGIFPFAHRNPVGHLTLVKYDPSLGVQRAVVDPNELVTQWAYDGFGGVTKELRPDGTTTTYKTTRTEDGGPQKNAWNVKLQTTTTGGEDSLVELDSLGRAVRSWRQGVKVGAQQQPPRVMNEIRFDTLGEHVERSLVPASEQAPPNSLAYDHWEHDSIGRPLNHTTPWGAVTTYRYVGKTIETTGPNGAVTRVENDARGRPVKITDPEGGVLSYTYGPFAALRTVKDAGHDVTTTERDAFGRVVLSDDPDRGITTAHYDGFGQQTKAVDAAERTFSFTYDAIGRITSRADSDGITTGITTWKYDVASKGIGQLAEVKSPAGIMLTYSYDTVGRPEATERTVNGETFTVSMTYDPEGRPATTTYPKGNGLGFSVKHEYDPHGHLLAVRDLATNVPYWELVSTDSAGRIQTEKLGGGATAVTTTRAYFEEKDRVKSILTTTGATTIQSLSYGYDDRLNLTHRTDARQSKTEYFGYDRLDRLTSSAFSLAVRPDKYTYSQNGNLVSKPGVGSYVYDPAHPHAVWIAGGEFYANDAVGNQRVRPGATIEYTAFDLPKTFSLDGGAGTIELEYDGNQERVRKSTPKAETIYFGSLYERVTDKNSGEVEHRYYVHDSERLVATVTWESGEADKTEYVHVDNLGSIEAVTNSAGTVVERRSYDAFGAPRNPQWGAGSLLVAPKMTRGFTGHERDDELGLVNMKGRLYDPKLGRFLTPDPILSNPAFSQSWNPYSYVRNNPLAYVDPSGFTGEEPGGGVSDDSGLVSRGGIDGAPDMVVRFRLEASQEPHKATEAGARTEPNDMGVTGNAAGHKPEPPPTETEEPSGLAYAGRVSIGAGKGLFDLALSLLEFVGMNAASQGGYGPCMIGKSVWDGFEDDGILGAANAMNPAFPVFQGFQATANAVERNDPEGVGRGGMHVLVFGGVALYGAVQGGLAANAAAGAEAAAAESMAAKAATGGVPRAYSVSFETTIPRVGAGKRIAHFQSANRALLEEMAKNPELAASMRRLIPDLESSLLTPSGRVLGTPPPGWTWHHVPGRPGVLQLVPRAQHSSGSAFQPLLHPNGRGGFLEWGALY